MNNLCFSSSLALANIRKEDSIWNQLWFVSHETGVQTQTCFDLNQYMVDLCLRIELLLSAKEQIESKVSFSRRGSIQLAHLVVNPHILSCEDDNRYGMLWYCMVWRKTSWRTKLSCWNFLLSHWKKVRRLDVLRQFFRHERPRHLLHYILELYEFVARGFWSILRGMGGGSTAVWNLSENSSDLVAWPVPYTVMTNRAYNCWKKHTLNPEITFLYQIHDQKALFKVPKIWFGSELIFAGRCDRRLPNSAMFIVTY